MKSPPECKLGALSVPSSRRTSNMRLSTFSLLYLPRGVLVPLLIVPSIPRITLELFDAGRREARLANSLFQVLHCYLLGIVEIICILPLDRVHQRLAHIKTLFRELHRFFVFNHLVLVGYQSNPESTDERKAKKRTLTKASMVLTVPKTCFAGETSTAFLFKISIRSLKNALALRVAIATGLA